MCFLLAIICKTICCVGVSWDFKETERGDIVWRFTLPQVDWLKDNDHIPKDF